MKVQQWRYICCCMNLDIGLTFYDVEENHMILLCQIVEARRVHNYGNQLQVKLSAKKSLSEEDHIELENFIQQYYKIPFEKRANDYADLHYREAYEILKEHGFLE